MIREGEQAAVQGLDNRGASETQKRVLYLSGGDAGDTVVDEERDAEDLDDDPNGYAVPPRRERSGSIDFLLQTPAQGAERESAFILGCGGVCSTL